MTMLPAAVAITACVLLLWFSRVAVRVDLVVVCECQEILAIDKRVCVAVGIGADLLVDSECLAYCENGTVILDL